MRQAILAGCLSFGIAALVSASTAYAGPQGTGVQQSAAQTANVAGTVSQDAGQPVTDATVTMSGQGAIFTTRTDAHGDFLFAGIPYGTYVITATSAKFGQAKREDVKLAGDIFVAIRFAPKTLAVITTRSAGTSINITAASIASVAPSDFAFKGNPSWRELLNSVPGVTVGGNEFGGGTTSVIIPDSPFQPIIVSINGAQPYETSTTFDGMPLSNASFNTGPGQGVDLSALPMPLFDTADVVRGPGANAPSIVDSVGGSFVLHAPGMVNQDAFEYAVGNDAYGGYLSNAKASLKIGKLSATAVYGFDVSPGPDGSGPFFGGLLGPATIDGQQVASGGLIGFPGDPTVGNCFCIVQTSLIGFGAFQSTRWSEHQGGLALSYQLSPRMTAQTFYAGSQDNGVQPDFLRTDLFTPGSTYSGPPLAGAYPGRILDSAPTPELQSGSLWEEKLTSYLGVGVLRLAALQNTTYANQDIPSAPPSHIRIWGTGAFCADPGCATTTPFTFTGQTALVTFAPFAFVSNVRSNNLDELVDYETPLSEKTNVGISFVKALFGDSVGGIESGVISGVPFEFTFGVPFTSQSEEEERLHIGVQATDKVYVDTSYYVANGNYHVQNPADPTGRTWADSRFPYSAPRLSATWRVNADSVLRAALGGGFALPPLFELEGGDFPAQCGPTSCTEQVTNLGLKPETSFGFDVGMDRRLQANTILSADLYLTNLYGQIFQSVNLVGTLKGLPLYAQEYLNLTQSRFDGVNLAIRRDPSSGTYWNLNLGLTRGYIVSVPSGFYDQAGTKCDRATGVGCVNTYAIPNANFDGEFESVVPYANGTASYGYRWGAQKYLDLTANYFGNNNGYFQPAFFEFDAHAGFPMTKALSLIASVNNVTGIHDQSYQLLTVNKALIAPSIAGFEFPLYPVPYGPRTLVLTLNIKV